MKLRLTGRLLARSAFMALAAWLALWLGVLAGAPPLVRLTWAALSLFPLALLAPFIFRGTRAGYTWAGFLSLGYFALGVMVTWGSHSAHGAVLIFLSILLYFSASAALREMHSRG